MKSTKIVCTTGPASQDKDILKEMILAGMNIARINFSHGNHNFHLQTIKNIRELSKKLNSFTGILCDLQGPKIRIGNLQEESVELKKGKEIILTTDKVIGNSDIISINYMTLPSEIKIGKKIFLDDGNIELKVKSKDKKNIICKIINGGFISPHKGINLPYTNLSIPALTDKDKKDLEFALDNDVDFIALSFVRKPEDIIALKKIIDNKKKNTFIIAKIEKPEAVEKIDKIIKVADGLMVARGDLGAETSSQEVPVLQKAIIKKCNLAGKPVITATQMLESMINNPRPTRAEASDVANAILDGSDAVMLSGETAIGKYPIKAVKIMADIAKRIEKEIFKKNTFHIKTTSITEPKSISDTIAYSTCKILDVLKVKYIIGFTLTGRTAKLLSKYRPCSPIIAMSPVENVLQQLSIYWGINSVFIPKVNSTEKLFDSTEEILVKKTKLAKEGDTIILVGGVPVMKGYQTNMIKIHNLKVGDKNI